MRSLFPTSLCTLCLPTWSAPSSLGCGLSSTSPMLLAFLLVDLPQPSTCQEKPFSGDAAALYLLGVYSYCCYFLQKLNLALCSLLFLSPSLFPFHLQKALFLYALRRLANLSGVVRGDCPSWFPHGFT